MAEGHKMTYAVCQELGQEADSEGISHCERFILPFAIKQADGTFSPILGCTANCHVACRDKKFPPCGQPLLVSPRPFQISYLRRPFQPCLQEWHPQNEPRKLFTTDRSNQGKNLIITGPGMSLQPLKFDPLTQHRDQIMGFIFTRTSMTKESVLESLREYNSRVERRLWLNLFCAYKSFLISYESEKGLTPSVMDAKRMYCTTQDELPNLLLLFVSILATFVNKAHVARPDYFSYANIKTTLHTDHPLTTNGRKL